MGSRLAAVDIGTNSIRCIIVETDGKGSFRVLDDEKATVRLGEGLAQTGEISEAAVGRGIEALARMRKIIDGFRVEAIEAVATSAVRSARNGSAFLARVIAETGIPAEVISGEEEAELAALSARNQFDMEGIRYGVLDIGGGSTELVISFGMHTEELHSLDMGAVTLTEKFLHSDPPGQEEYRKLRKHVAKALSEIELQREQVPFLVASGGTATSLAAMVTAMRNETYPSVHRHEILRSDVVHLLAMLLRKELKERRNIPGLSADRADIIIAGVAAVDEVMALLGANILKINERGIREGLILRGLRRHGLLGEEPPKSWREGVLQFGRSCRFDEEHSLQVAKLSLGIFDALSGTYRLDEKDRRILEAAAILHDTGYLISYSGHHKHSYFLIRHADLFGFTPRERELTATIARYHRKSLPKKKHLCWQALPEADRPKAVYLAGILRLADGLDRRRTSHLSEVSFALEGETFMVRIPGGGDSSVEVHGGKGKSDLFEKAFGRKVVFSLG